MNRMNMNWSYLLILTIFFLSNFLGLCLKVSLKISFSSEEEQRDPLVLSDILDFTFKFNIS